MTWSSPGPAPPAWPPAVTQERFLLLSPRRSLSLPMFAPPPLMHKTGCYIASLGDVSRWLSQQAEALGVEIYPGMAVV